jgi:hypothetical protein
MTKEPTARLATAFLTFVIVLLTILLLLPTFTVAAGGGLP